MPADLPADNRGVLVVGGGLAGISAALRLADDGYQVVLAEARPRLGGAAFSFRRGELSVDNGQHVFLRCCTAYLQLLARLGVGDRITMQSHLDVPVLRPDGVVAHLRRTPGLPAPFHLTAALLRYPLLSVTDRARAVIGALALRRLDPADESLDVETLGGFLRRHGQNDATIAALWGLIATATLNCDPDQASLRLAAKVFRTGMLDRAAAGDIGHAAVPLAELHHDAPLAALTAAGVRVLFDTRASEIAASDDGLSVRLTDRQGWRTHRFEAVVLALPAAAALAAAPELAQDPVARAADLGTSPIVNIHLVYDRTVMELPFAAAVDSPVQWVFDRTSSSGLGATVPNAQYLAVTVSAAIQEIDEPSRALCQRFDSAVRALFPAAANAELLDAFVTRERRATFDQRAGSSALRPGALTSIKGLQLAGAWTATGWPDTMEGAVRSGLAVAETVTELLQLPKTEAECTRQQCSTVPANS
jgi:squalene-associated FAD-dependent desaturase